MRAKFARLLALAALLALTACQTPLEAAPLPTASMARVQHTPALRPLSARIAACAGDSETVFGVLRDEVPAQALDLSAADLTFKLGVPDPLPPFAAPIGEMQVVVITHADNIVKLSLQELAGLYSGEIETWEASGDPVQLWTYPPGDDLRAAFEAAAPDDLSLSPRLYIAPDVDAMLEAVGENPGAVGYAPADRLTGAVSRVALWDEFAPSLVVPVMALAETAPQGAAYELLTCLQAP